MDKPYHKKVVKLGERIKSVRLSNGLTQVQLASMCDVDIRTIQRIEVGTSVMSVIILFKIAKVLEVSTEELIKEL